jgi:MFS transporter, SHS family, lactate transporter
MATAVETVRSIPWWKEPTKDQWYAYVAAWAGWTLDAFDFTAFLLIIAPIAKEFDVPVPEVVFDRRGNDEFTPSRLFVAGRQ